MSEHNVEIQYDKDGNKKSVVMSYNLYLEFLSATHEFDNMRNKLNELYYILSDVVEQRTPVELSEIDVDSAETDIDIDAAAHQSIREDEPDLRYYQRARGYYEDSKRFRVLGGSKVRGSVSPTFESIDSLSRLRKRLIDTGVLNRENPWEDYEFTRDFTFKSPSAAASLVDGNSRSSPEAWGRSRI